MSKSQHLLDPQLRGAAALFPQPDYWKESLSTIRATVDSFVAALPRVERPGVVVEKHRIRAAAGHEIEIVLWRPAVAVESARPAILHVHGGGYVVGSYEISAGYLSSLALDLDALVASVEYRLAPECRHPGPVEDCYAALKWLSDSAQALTLDRSRIAVMGESAGGGLAAALCLLVRDRGEVAVTQQTLFYPMLDDRTCIREEHPYAGEFVWTAQANRFGWSALLGCAPGSDAVPGYAAAARADNLTGLPSTCILVGALDLFVEENIEFARRLIRAGVPTELHVYPGAYHAFDLVENAEVARVARECATGTLRKALTRYAPV